MSKDGQKHPEPAFAVAKQFLSPRVISKIQD